MINSSFLPPRRSFLGPYRPTWSDFQRLRTLRQMEQVIRRKVSTLMASPTSRRIVTELETENHQLELVRREISELEHLLALL